MSGRWLGRSSVDDIVAKLDKILASVGERNVEDFVFHSAIINDSNLAPSSNIIKGVPCSRFDPEFVHGRRLGLGTWDPHPY